MPLTPEHDVDLLEGPLGRGRAGDAATGASGPGRGRHGVGVVEEAVAGEGLADAAYAGRVVEVARDRDDHVRRGVVPLVEPPDLVARHRRDRRLRTRDGPAQRRVAVGLAREQVVHHVVGVVVVHGDLVEDHVTLGLDVLGRDRRGGDHVAEHVDGQRQVLVEHPGVEAGVLLRGEGVELPAHRVERHRDVQRRALRGALEQQVLEEVRAAVQRRRLVARPDVDPHTDRSPTARRRPAR